jgi:hypothetical protein
VRLLTQDDESMGLAISPDGALVASASRDGTIGLVHLTAPDDRDPADALSTILAGHQLRLFGLKLEDANTVAPPARKKGGRSSTPAKD